MNNELKPCPFCGGDGELRNPDSGFVGDENRFIVSCTQCYATAWHINNEFTCQVGHDTEQEAIEAWNTRVEQVARGVSEYANGFDCSSCGHKIYLWSNSTTMPFPARFCPECGAKVVK